MPKVQKSVNHVEEAKKASLNQELQFLPVKGKRGIYYTPTYRSEKLNLSGALALFAPTYEDLELLKQDLIENMADSVNTIRTQRSSKTGWVHEEVTKLMVENATAEPRRAIRRIVQRQQFMLKPTMRQGGVTEAQIEQAKEYPLEDLITNRIFKATGKWIGNCHCPLPDHSGERTPSFYIDKHNRFKCFGCQQSGDAIAFVMLRDEVDFIKAVKSLIS